MTPEEVSRAFVAAINSHDIEALGALMTDDHVFVDGLGARMTGRSSMVAGWRGYFGMVPDYWIRLDRVISDEDAVALFGKAGGTFVAAGQRLDAANRWEIPGAWLAEVRDGKLAQWHVFADNMPIRRLMGAEHA
jgi:ketosteroid isomerase-like protein